jgi:LAO/AO transport system kinase
VTPKEFERARETGDIRVLAKAISLAEDDPGAAQKLAEELVRGQTDAQAPALAVGITGPPGVGKSTLVSALVQEIRSRDQSVAVLAIDPSSPFTGGALLGDRVRMNAHATDPRVFIRSIATRGALGGLSEAVGRAVAILGHWGFDWIIVETAGVGQSEIDVAAAVDTVVLVLSPGAGDDVQLMKSGIMEIADLFVVNKSDLPGAERVRSGLLAMQPASAAGAPVHVLLTSASTPGAGSGVERILEWLTARRNGTPWEPAADSDRHVAGQHLEAVKHPGAGEHPEPGHQPHKDEDPIREDDDPISGLRAVSSVDHIGIAVEDLAASIAAYEALGLGTPEIEEVEDQKVRVAVFSCGESRVELLQSTDPQGPIAKFIEKRGPGIHHVALGVDDLDARLAELKSRGVRLIDEVAREGAGGARIAFVHPKATGGVLLELCERIASV